MKTATPSTSHKKRKLTQPILQHPIPPFEELFKCALHGLCAQFEDQNSDNLNPRWCYGASELERAQQLVRRAWNLARFAEAMFKDDEQAIEAFNAELEAAAKADEEAREKFINED